jgi:group II intron reverse transcriptase/maturase
MEEMMATKLERIADKSAKEPKLVFTSLYHLINEGMLIQCHRELDGRKAVGIDKVSKEEYESSLKSNIADLVRRLKTKSYKPQPSLRVYIPKGNGKMRPLGIAAYEDKIVQLALKKIVEAVYEPKFLENMHGFRPNRNCHGAIKTMCREIVHKKINYIVDADIKGFFNHMNHEWMMKFLEQHIHDPNILWLVKKYLKAGVMEDGEYMPSEEGSAQGNIISPVLANIYMHYVLMLWFKVVAKKRTKGECFLIVYADDFIAGFQHQWEAEAYYSELQKRMNKFGLELESSKSRLLEFGRYAIERRKVRGERKPETFDFLGFTFYCGKSQEGRFCVIPKTSRKKYAQKVKNMKEWLRTRLTYPIKSTMETLNRKLVGHYRYYGITHNGYMLVKFHYDTTLVLFKMMNRRSQKRSYTWEGFRMMLEYYPMARPKIYNSLYT